LVAQIVINDTGLTEEAAAAAKMMFKFKLNSILFEGRSIAADFQPTDLRDGQAQ